MTFSEAWLREYEQRRAAQAARPAAPLAPILLTLSRPTPSLNQLIRMHWSKRRKLAAAISAELAPQLPPGPRGQFQKAFVTITRYSIREMDEDNLRGCKLLIDCLLPLSERHPHGLGLVLDDSPTHMIQRIGAVVVAHLKEQRTELKIESAL